ncbi:MAG: MFS transporter [Planctomycetota bacterium]
MSEAANSQYSINTNVRLSTMMFLQYILFAVWWVPLAALLSNEGVTGWQKTGILSTMAIGFFMAPVVGMIADRYMPSQRVLFIFNLLGGVLLFVAAGLASAEEINATLLFGVLVIQQLCYMPTWSLANSIAMANSPQEKFPQIRAFGSIGWVASGVFGIFFLYMWGTMIDGSPIPMYIGAVISFIAAVYALTLPHTPPPAKGQKASLIDVLGLRTFTMMKDFNFAVFAIVSLLAMIPFAIYFNFGSQFLNDEGFELITFTMNWGQVGEIVFMLGIPLVIARIGLKWAMAVGLLALLVRYVAFYFGSAGDMIWLYYVAILVHGLIFGFFCVGGQMYTEKKAPKEMKASAQGFVFLVTFGVGMLLGNIVSNNLIEGYRHYALQLPEEFSHAADARFAEEVTVPGASVSDINVYDRVLNNTEMSRLAGQTEQGDGSADEAQESVDMESGLFHEGDELAELAEKTPPEQLSVSFKVTLPVKGEGAPRSKRLSGDLFRVGEGSNALRLSLRNGDLVCRAGEDRAIEAYRIQLPRTEKNHEMWLGATYDGTEKELQLYHNGAVYVLYDWLPVWGMTCLFSLIVLVGFILLFNDEIARKETQPVAEVAQEPDAGEDERL